MRAEQTEAIEKFLHQKFMEKLKEYVDCGLNISHFAIVSLDPDPSFIEIMSPNDQSFVKQQNESIILVDREKGKLETQEIRNLKEHASIESNAQRSALILKLEPEDVA